MAKNEFQIPIPESVKNFKMEILWGLDLKQIIMLFSALVLIVFGFSRIYYHQYVIGGFLFTIAVILAIGYINIKGHNIYVYVLHKIKYFLYEPQMWVYQYKNTQLKKDRIEVEIEKTNKGTWIIAGSLGALLVVIIIFYFIIHAI